MMDLMVELESTINTIQRSDKPNHLQAFIEALLGDSSNPQPTPPHSTEEHLTFPQPLPPFSPSTSVWYEPHPLPSLFPANVFPEPWSFPHSAPPPPPPPPSVPPEQWSFPHPAPPPPPSVPPEQWSFPHPAPPPPSALQLPLPDNVLGNMVPVGTVNGEVVYGLPPVTFPTVFPATPAQPKHPRKKRPRQQDDEQPYIKKPPNAFMLFLREQRPKVVAELNITNNAEINAELGQRWRVMLQVEKERYFIEAEEIKRLHEQQFPQWSTRDNYGKKRKRIRKRDLMAAKGW